MKKYPYYVLTLRLRVKTKKQAKELRDHLLFEYKKKVEMWVGNRLPKTWGKMR